MDLEGQSMTWKWMVKKVSCVVTSAICLFFFSPCSLFSSLVIIPMVHDLYSDLRKIHVVISVACTERLVLTASAPSGLGEYHYG